MKTIVIKIGTNAIIDDHGNIDSAVLQNLTAGVAHLRQQGIGVVLVSSGAVGAARREFKAEKFGKISPLQLAQIRSSVGQPLLMMQYRNAFAKFNIPVAQGLVTREDFASREHQIAMRAILHKMLEGGILPILNENDFLTPEELDFSDNDQLAGFLAGMLQAERLILLSNINGLYTAHPSDPAAKKLNRIEEVTPEILGYASDTKSEHGLGGMASKLKTARMMNQLGIEMVLGCSREPDVLQNMLAQKPVGTVFPPKYTDKKSGIRVWLAAGAAEKGSITLDCPIDRITQKKGTGVSILGVGIKKVSGVFTEGDVILLQNPDDTKVGRGVAKLSASEMHTLINSPRAKGKIFIRADSLFLF
jgi:glutamate 5-kinase